MCTVVDCEIFTPLVAETITGTSAPTIAASTVTERQALPEGTLTDAGTDRMLGRLLFKVTFMPPAAVAPVRHTVSLPLPPARMTDCTLRLRNTGALTITDFVTLQPPAEAVTTTVVSLETGLQFAENVNSLAPAGTVTVAGTVIADFEELIDTFTPPDGATAVRRTRNVTW